MATTIRLLKPGDLLPPHSFGVAGVDSWDELTTVQGKIGVVRDVRIDVEGGHVGGVDYEFESLSADGGCRWRRSSETGRWELDLGTSRDPQNLTSYTSLERLAQKIRDRFRRSGRLPPEDDDLLTLDKVISDVLAKVAALHGAHQIVGLLTPENIVCFLDDKRELRVLLPDAGFRWRGAPPVPPWLQHLEQKWSELWHPKACDVFQRREWSPEAERADLVLLARLCVWLLEGSVKDADQTACNRFLQGARDKGSSAPAPCWQTLYQTVATDDELKRIPLRRIATVAEFASRINKTPLSEHFRSRRARQPRSLPWKAIGVAVLLLALVGAAGYSVLDPGPLNSLLGLVISPGRPPNRLCPDCQHPSALLPILDELEPVLMAAEASVADMKRNPAAAHDSQLRATVDHLTTASRMIAKLAEVAGTSNGNHSAERTCIANIDQRYGASIDELGTAFVASAQAGHVVDQQGVGGRIVRLFDAWQEQSPTNPKEKPSWHQIIHLTLLGG
jgi:hypothetical protein